MTIFVTLPQNRVIISYAFNKFFLLTIHRMEKEKHPFGCNMQLLIWNYLTSEEFPYLSIPWTYSSMRRLLAASGSGHFVPATNQEKVSNSGKPIIVIGIYLKMCMIRSQQQKLQTHFPCAKKSPCLHFPQVAHFQLCGNHPRLGQRPLQLYSLAL